MECGKDHRDVRPVPRWFCRHLMTRQLRLLQHNDVEMAIARGMGCLTIFAIFLILSGLVNINSGGSRNIFFKRMDARLCNAKVYGH